MAKLIEQPEQFKAELQDKWLDYYEVNRNWLKSLMLPNNGFWYEPAHYEKEELEDERYQPCRPNSVFILGVVSVLEPEIQGLCNFVPPMKPSEIIKHLGLNFDPEIELKKRAQQKSKEQSQQQIETDCNYLDKIREEIKT